MITSADLKTQTKNDLAQMAKRLGLAGWNALSKDQLVVAIVKAKKSGKPAAKSAGNKSAAPSRLAEPSKTLTTKAAKAKNGGISSSKSAPVVKNAVVRNAAVKNAAASVAKKSKKSATAAKPVSVNKSGTVGKLAGKTVNKAKLSASASSKAAAAKSKSVKASTVKSAPLKSGSANDAAAKVTAGKGGSLVRSGKKNAAPVATTTSHTKTAHVGKPKTNGVMVAGAAKKTAAKKPTIRKPSKPVGPPTDPAVLEQIRRIQSEREAIKDLSGLINEPGSSGSSGEESPQKDRVVLVVRDAFWLQVNWDLTRRVVERARAAMAEHWHHAQPIIRLLRLDDTGTTSSAETIERDIPIHSGVRNWYVDLNGTPGRFRVMIGYLSGNRFHMLAKSNIVRTPTPGSTDAVDDHWSDIARDAERIFALSGGYDSEQETTELQEVFEDRLKRSMGGPQLAQYGSGAETAYRARGGFHFDLEVELYVYGSTVPDGFVTLNGEPVKLRSDGSFAMRLPFPDRRQVLPAVACSRDGVQQRTVVIAVERNTKVMEPFSKEQDDQG